MTSYPATIDQRSVLGDPSLVLSTERPPVIRQAGFVTRLVAFLLDIIFVTVGSIVFAALISLVLNFFGFSEQNLHADDNTRTVIAILETTIVIVSGLSVLLFIPGYFVAFWVLFGATPGKQLLGLKVIRTKKQRLGWGRATLRYIGYFISAIVLFIGYFWVLVDGRRQAWHDKLADTFVVYTWDVREIK